jgi:enamine deaminase RidA (YjgF/YER057c/UK114 family)
MLRLPLLMIWAALTGSAVQAQPPEMFVPEGGQGTVEYFRMAPAIRVDDLVFISGIVAWIPEGETATPELYETQIRSAFQRVEETLNLAGSGWADVVEMTTFHVDMRAHQEIFLTVRQEFITQEPYPAWTAIGVEQLWTDPLFVEIRVIAHIDEE